MASRIRARRAAYVSMGGVLGLSFVMACGSRTGLFVPAPDGTDGDADVLTADASRDATRDVNPDPPDAPITCIPGRFAFSKATAQMMFVIDRSGSMATSLDGRSVLRPGERSRWQILRAGLAATITSLDQEVSMGAKFFPRYRAFPAPGCGLESTIDVAPALGNAASILAFFDSTSPIGGTPTAEALRIAATHMTGIRGVARTLVLATDGAPNCNEDHAMSPCVCTTGAGTCPPDQPSLCLDDARTIDTIRDIAEKQKVPVYVIGIGSQESAVFRGALDRMAVAGGRAKPTSPRFYSAETETELGAALGAVRDSVGSCTFLSPSAPEDPDGVEVTIDGADIARDPSRVNGWDWIDKDYGTLQLFGAACEDAKTATEIAGVVACD